MLGVTDIPFNELGAIAAVCGLLVFVIRWLLVSFAERLQGIEDSLDEVNDAVNHRHEKRGPDAKKLYDLAVENHERARKVESQVAELVEWKRGYSEGPLDTGQKVLAFCEETSRRFSKIDEKLDEFRTNMEYLGCPKITGKGDKLCNDVKDKDKS